MIISRLVSIEEELFIPFDEIRRILKMKVSKKMRMKQVILTRPSDLEWRLEWGQGVSLESLASTCSSCLWCFSHLFNGSLDWRGAKPLYQVKERR